MRTIVVLITCTVMFCGIACTPQNAPPTKPETLAQAERAVNAERAANEVRFQNLLGILNLNQSVFGGGFSDVLDQCESAESKSENFDLMMNRAEETVFWLSSSLIKDTQGESAATYRDRGYELIVQQYISAQKLDHAAEAANKIEDDKLREQMLAAVDFEARFQAGDPEARAVVLSRQIAWTGHALPPPEWREQAKERRSELRQVALEIPNPIRSAEFLLNAFVVTDYVDDKTELAAAFNEIVDRLLTPGNEDVDDSNKRGNLRLFAFAIHRLVPAGKYIDDKTELAAAFNEIVDRLLTPGNEDVDDSNKRLLLFAINSLLPGGKIEQVEDWEIDLILAIIHSEQIPELWREELYTKAADTLFRNARSNSSKFRVDDYQKLFDLIESPVTKVDLLRRRFVGTRADVLIEKRADVLIKIDEQALADAVLTIQDSLVRFLTCDSLISSLRARQSNVDLLPLVDAMEHVALTETEKESYLSRLNTLDRALNLKVTHLYERTLSSAQSSSLWDDEKIADWRQRSRAAHIAVVHNRVAAAREISPNDPVARLEAYREAISIAVERHFGGFVISYEGIYDSSTSPPLILNRNLLDHVREIVAEALEYIDALPPAEVRRRDKQPDDLIKYIFEPLREPREAGEQD